MMVDVRFVLLAAIVGLLVGMAIYHLLARKKNKDLDLFKQQLGLITTTWNELCKVKDKIRHAEEDKLFAGFMEAADKWQPRQSLLDIVNSDRQAAAEKGMLASRKIEQTLGEILDYPLDAIA